MYERGIMERNKSVCEWKKSNFYVKNNNNTETNYGVIYARMYVREGAVKNWAPKIFARNSSCKEQMHLHGG